MNPKRLKFTNRNGVELAAHLYMPADQKPKFFALFAHCFTCSKNFSAVTRICRALSLNGIAALSFDFTGLGMSEGEFEESSFSSNISDLLDAAEFIEKDFQAPKMLIGHSLGGAAVLYAAMEMPAVKAVVTIAAPAYPGHVRNLFSDSVAKIEKNGSAKVTIGGRPFTVSKSFLDDLEQKPLDTFLKKLRKSLLVLHSPQDEIVEVSNAAEIYSSALHPKSFISLDGADHLISNPQDSEYIAEVIGSWSKRYVIEQEEKQENDTRGNQVFVRLSGEKYT
ncbi:MAG: alpha/beta fold hydrolase, partial [Algoriphagus sp.]